MPQPENPGCQSDATNTAAVTDTLETKQSSDSVDLQSQVGKSITARTNPLYMGYGSEILSYKQTVTIWVNKVHIH